MAALEGRLVCGLVSGGPGIVHCVLPLLSPKAELGQHPSVLTLSGSPPTPSFAIYPHHWK